MMSVMPTVVRAGVPIYYESVGSGPAVLWHTGGGGDGVMWARAGWLDCLPGHRHLIVDHRGHGRSGRPTELAAHAHGEYISDLLAVLDHAGVDRAGLVGYSDGGWTVLATAARHPDRVALVITVGTIPEQHDEPGERIESAAEVRTSGVPAVMLAFASEEAHPPPAWMMANLSRTETEMFALELEGRAADVSLWSELPAVEAPVLLICGDLEAPDASDLVGRAVERFRDCEAVVHPDVAHLEVFWNVGLSGPTMATFVAAHRSAWRDRPGPGC
jgi:pimeloyl-ACP methyl ester carboxylesterase